MISDNEINFPHKLSLTNRQVASLRKALANKSSTDIKLLKTQLSKSVLITLGLTAVASAADAEIHKKILGSGRRHSSSASNNHSSSTTLIISNDKI